MGRFLVWPLGIAIIGVGALDCSVKPVKPYDGGPGGDGGSGGAVIAGAGGDTGVGGGAGSIGGAGSAGTGGSADAGSTDGGGSDVRPCGAGIIADSVCDFSSTQGQKGWFYGYIEPQGANTFVPATQFASVRAGKDAWFVADGTYWTFVSASTVHPNGTITSGGRTPTEQWAVRRWQSTVAGSIKIGVTVRKEDSTFGPNGVMARVLVNGAEIWSQRLLADDRIGAEDNLPADVEVGSTIDLVVEPFEGDDRNDETYFTATIRSRQD